MTCASAGLTSHSSISYKLAELSELLIHMYVCSSLTTTKCHKKQFIQIIVYNKLEQQ